MGSELNRAFQKRQLGDYEYTFVISQEETEQTVRSGRQFVQAVIEYLLVEKRIPREIE